MLIVRLYIISERGVANNIVLRNPKMIKGEK